MTDENALSNFFKDSMSLTSAPTVPRELAVTVTGLVLLGVVWTIVEDRQFLLVFSLVFGVYSAIRLGLAARKQARAQGRVTR